MAIAIFNFSSSNTPPVAMPNPNGYDGIVHAGIAVSSNFWAYKKMDLDQLRTALKTNAPAIAEGHTALKLKCRMHPQWGPGPNSVDEDMAPINLSDAFAAEGRLAELENRPQDAVRAYLELARLGSQSPQGGLLADGLIAMRTEYLGVDSLQKLSATLDSKSCADIAETLESLEAQTQPVSVYRRQEKALFKQNYSGAGATFSWYCNQFYFRNDRKKAESTYLKLQTKVRQGMIAIAARSYQLDKGSPAKSVNDLVPKYLKAVPKNPATGAALTLMPQI